VPHSPTSPGYAYVERNVRTMSAIGGVYDMLTDQIVHDHGEILREGGFAVDLYWRYRSMGHTPDYTYREIRARMSDEILIELLNADATFPTRGYDDDAGIDLYTSTDMWINPGDSVDVPTAVAMQFPPSVWGMLVGRSSTLRKHDLLVNTGIIDTGYRGELFINVHNLGKRAFSVHKGMRLAQIIPMSNLAPKLPMRMVDFLDEHERGAHGFGSTGV